MSRTTAVAIATTLTMLAFGASGAAAANYVVDMNSDGVVSACDPAAPNDCSLRGAIGNANTNGGPDVITFAQLVNQISLGTPVTLTTPGTTLDGGSSVTLRGVGGLTVLVIEAGATDSVVRDLAFAGAAAIGIDIKGDRTLLDGNRIGAAFGSGTADASGSAVRVLDADDVEIQGNQVLGSNVAVHLQGTSDGTVVRGNRLGGVTAPEVDGGLVGVGVENTVTDAVIGDDDDAAGRNVFSGLAQSPVSVLNTATRIQVEANVFDGPAEPFVELGGTGRDAADNDDVDTGPNGLQNAPDLTDARLARGTLALAGTLESTPDTDFTIRAWVGSRADCTRAEAYVGKFDVHTNAQGEATFETALPAPAVTGEVAFVTATGPEGSSETSVCEDASDLVVDTETDSAALSACTAAANDCSLRGALAVANSTAGDDGIVFADSVATILAPSPPLPTVTDDGTTIDGGGDVTLDVSGQGAGIQLNATAADSTIRGLAVVGATVSGIRSLSDGARILDNRIGVAWGSTTVRAATSAVDIRDGDDVLVEGNELVGIGAVVSINASTPATAISGGRVRGNRIGSVTAPAATGNGGAGVNVSRFVSGVVIGDDADPAGRNTFTAGVRGDVGILQEASGITVEANRFANGDPFIGLETSTRTPNDPGDADTGPNGLLNFPVITAVERSAATLTVRGTYDSAPSTTVRMRAMTGAACSGTSDFLGTFDVTTDAAGHATFEEDLPLGGATGQAVFLWATGADGSSSETSPCRRTGDLVVDTIVDDESLRTCAAAVPGDCSLRGAVGEATLDAGPDTITFADALGSATIALAAQVFVAAQEPLSIDGGGDITLRAMAPVLSTLRVDADDVTIRGLAFTGTASRALLLEGDRARVTGSRFGAPWGAPATEPPDDYGLQIAAATGITVGPGNEFLGSDDGMLISSGTPPGNVVVGNRFATAVNGVVAFGSVTVGSDDDPARQNTFDGPARSGVWAFNPAAKSITVAGNVFRTATGIPVDLFRVGESLGARTPNDAGDADTGVNELQNFPVVARAEGNGSAVAVSGSLDSTAGTYRVRAWLGSSCGRAETFLGAFDAVAGAPFTQTLAASRPVVDGEVVVLSATTADGSSSEMSDCADVAFSRPGVAPSSLDFGTVEEDTAADVQTVVFSNAGGRPLALSSVTISGPAFSRAGGTCADGAVLARDESCTVGVRFAPETGGTFSGSLVFVDDVAGDDASVALSGVARAREVPTPTPSPSPTTTPPPSLGPAPPAPVVLGGPPLVSPLRDATFTFGPVAPGVRLECSLDGRPFVPCRNPQVYRGLGQGAHTLLVRQVSPTGVAGPPTTFRWTVRCGSRRAFTLNLRAQTFGPRVSRILRATLVDRQGKRIKRLVVRRSSASVDLRGQPRGSFRVRLEVRLKSGKRRTYTKTYRTCGVRR